MEELELPYFDVVVCNLYPFEENNTIENIDIGGVSLIRASGKNYNNIILLSNPEQYDDFINNFNNNNDDLGISLQKRKQLAAKGFTMTSNYDNHIQQFFNKTDIQ